MDDETGTVFRGVYCWPGFTFLVFPEASAQAPTSVSSVTFHRDDDQQERIRIKLVGTHAPKVFALKGDNPRLICDFPGAGYAGLVKPVLKAEGTLVKGIRVGAHQSPDKKVRVVLDLEPGRKYTYSREFNKEENILNIVLVPTEGARTAEVAVAKIDATESKQIVITGAKKVLHPVKEQKEIHSRCLRQPLKLPHLRSRHRKHRRPRSRPIRKTG